MPLWNTSEQRALGVPAGGGCTTAADLALLYQPLLNGGQVYGGGQILLPETIDRATTQTTDSRHFAYLFAPPAENPGRIPTHCHRHPSAEAPWLGRGAVW